MVHGLHLPLAATHLIALPSTAHPCPLPVLPATCTARYPPVPPQAHGQAAGCHAVCPAGAAARAAGAAGRRARSHTRYRCDPGKQWCLLADARNGIGLPDKATAVLLLPNAAAGRCYAGWRRLAATDGLWLYGAVLMPDHALSLPAGLPLLLSCRWGRSVMPPRWTRCQVAGTAGAPLSHTSRETAANT